MRNSDKYSHQVFVYEIHKKLSLSVFPCYLPKPGAFFVTPTRKKCYPRKPIVSFKSIHLILFMLNPEKCVSADSVDHTDQRLHSVIVLSFFFNS